MGRRREPFVPPPVKRRQLVYSLSNFERWCQDLRIDGRPLRLYPEQSLMLADYFAGVRESLILIPKKNGKTTLLAALALYHLTRTFDAYCVIGAASKDQATILYKQAKRLVAGSKLEELVKVQPGYRRIFSKLDGGEILVLASDENTSDGVIPTLALVDELHRHKTDGLYGVFRDGLGPRRGQMITISTAGDDEESPLGKLRTRAYSLPGLAQEGAYRHVHTEDFAMHEWALDGDANTDDLGVVKTANPAPWQDLRELRRRKESPSMTDWQWARFACGIWVFGEQGAIPGQEWRACEDSAAAIPEAASDVYVGVDLGYRWDTTAIVPVWYDRVDEVWVVGEEQILVPPRDGSSLEHDLIFGVLEDLAERYIRPTFVIDPEAGGERLAQQAAGQLTCEVVEHSQKPMPMALAAQRLSETIGSRSLRHRGGPELTRHVLAAAAKPVGEGWRLVKPRRSGAVIDGAVALAMGLSVGQAQLLAPAQAGWRGI